MDEYGGEFTYLDEHHTIPHSFRDNPCVQSDGKDQYWYRNGVFHRDKDQPAVILIDYMDVDWVKEWWQHGKRHRHGDKPAVVYSDGYSEYWIHGKRYFPHRYNTRFKKRKFY